MVLISVFDQAPNVGRYPSSDSSDTDEDNLPLKLLTQKRIVPIFDVPWFHGTFNAFSLSLVSISFDVFFYLFAGNLSRMKTRKNCVETAEVTTYRAIDGQSTPRHSVGVHRSMKEKMLNEYWGILTKYRAMEALDGQYGPSCTSVIVKRK